MAPAPLPSLRRRVFGRAWYERWAKEAPSMTSNGRREGSGFRGSIGSIWHLIPPSVRLDDFLAFNDALVGLVAAWPQSRFAEVCRGRNADTGRKGVKRWNPTLS